MALQPGWLGVIGQRCHLASVQEALLQCLMTLPQCPVACAVNPELPRHHHLRLWQNWVSLGKAWFSYSVCSQIGVIPWSQISG